PPPSLSSPPPLFPTPPPPSLLFFLITRPPPRSTLFPYTTLFRSGLPGQRHHHPLPFAPHGLAGGHRAPLAHHELQLEAVGVAGRSEEHTSELQSLTNLVCRLLLEKKKKQNNCRPTQDSAIASRAT